MSIVPVSGDSIAVTATKDGTTTVVVPKALGNADYQEMLGITAVVVARAAGVYNAFPDLREMGASLVGIYSSGAGHGNSDRQIMVRSDDEGATWTAVTFFENATLVYDNSLLTGLMATGDKETFKVFTIEKTAGGYSNTSVSTVANGGVTYALWSPPVETGGVLYRTGYGTRGSDTETALFQSADGGVTWSFVSLIAATAGKLYSEAALCECANGDFIAVIREDGFSATRPLWFSRSVDSGATWSAPSQFATESINGVQPFLMTLSSGDVILLAGDRVGSTGLSNNGGLSTSHGITGISGWRSGDHGATWTSRSMLAAMWSTDGGQPAAVELGDGTVGFLCYLAPSPTDTDADVEPVIQWVRFEPENLI